MSGENRSTMPNKWDVMKSSSVDIKAMDIPKKLFTRSFEEGGSLTVGTALVDTLYDCATCPSSKNPPKWTDVYPQGSKAGDEEQKLFIALARNPKWKFRSIVHLSKEANLTKERVEQILQKYYKKGMVFPNPKQEDQWAYWERVPELLPGNEKSLAEADQDKRCEDAV